MPRQRSPNRDKAFTIYQEHGGNIENRRIAEMLEISEKTVSGWKCKDKWEEQLNGVLQSNKRSTPNQKGGQPGNQNAVGHGAPEGNINAIKHGAYQTIYAAYLPEDEKAIYEGLPGEADLEAEIRLLRLKITRLLNRQEDFFYDMWGNKHDKKVSEEDREAGILACVKQLEKIVRTQDQIQKGALAVEEQKARIAKLQAETAKITGDDEDESVDDGFIDALKGQVDSVWQD